MSAAQAVGARARSANTLFNARSAPVAVARPRRRVYIPAMKVKDADILFVPGHMGAGPDHWQTRWQSKLSTGRRVEQADWSNPDRDDWVGALAAAVDAAERPVVLVAHSLGVSTVVHAAAAFGKTVAGAFLVAPPDLADPAIRPKQLTRFAPHPLAALPFASILIASRNDPYCAFAAAEKMADAWGSLLIDAGEAGHINADSGYGPWPEGSMAFARFLSNL
jgi:predicted alpha/beta hydrolase family esterase